MTVGAGPRGRNIWSVLFPLFQSRPLDFERIGATLKRRACPAIFSRAADLLQLDSRGDLAWLDDFSFAEYPLIMDFFMTAGQMPAAKRLLDHAKVKWAVTEKKIAAKMFDAAPMARVPPNFLDRVWQDVQVVDKRAPTTMVVWNGLAQRFGVHLNVLHLYLDTIEANVIYLRDFTRSYYIQGLASSGAVERTHEDLSRALERLATRRRVFLGASGGVFGALYWGSRLAADVVLCFAGATDINTGLEEKNEKVFYQRLYQLIGDGEIVPPNLRETYQRFPAQVRCFFGANNEFDARQANNLKGLPNVSLEPVENSDRHVVIYDLIRRGSFLPILQAACNPGAAG